MSNRPVVKVTYGHVAGCGWSGRGYAIFVAGQRVTPICLDARRAWDAYRFEQRHSQSSKGQGR